MWRDPPTVQRGLTAIARQGVTRRPSGERDAAWLGIARLAWNLGEWVAHIALRNEVSRWEWKRFRRVFVDFAVQVVRSARQTLVGILGANRSTHEILRAHQVLQL